jgi:hypothetical protein
MTIRAISLDFDGCIFNKKYIEDTQFSVEEKYKIVVEYNQDFLDKIKVDNKHYAKNIILVGSNRQCYVDDKHNFRSAGSCFPAIKEISKYIGATLDYFLLADIFFKTVESKSDKPLDLQEDFNPTKDQIPYFDETKGMLIYAQIHKIANENPEETIVLHFYDDRNYDDENGRIGILHALLKFYTVNTQLIPKNVTLHLHHYAGKNVYDMGQITGTGSIDKNFKETVERVARKVKSKQEQMKRREASVFFVPTYDNVIYVTQYAEANDWLAAESYVEPAISTANPTSYPEISTSKKRASREEKSQEKPVKRPCFSLFDTELASSSSESQCSLFN